MKSADESVNSLHNIISGVMDTSGSYAFGISFSSSSLIHSICIAREFYF